MKDLTRICKDCKCREQPNCTTLKHCPAKLLIADIKKDLKWLEEQQKENENIKTETI